MLWWTILLLCCIVNAKLPSYLVYNDGSIQHQTLNLPSTARSLDPNFPTPIAGEKFRTHSDSVDIYLLKFFKDKSGGFFVDFGITQWKDPSDTFVAEYFNGWNGVCVVSEISYLEDLVSNRHCTFYLYTEVTNSDGRLTNGTTSVNLLAAILEQVNAPRIIDYITFKRIGGKRDIDLLKQVDFITHTYLVLFVQEPTAEGFHHLKAHGYKLLHDVGPLGCFYVHRTKDDYVELMMQYHSLEHPVWLRDFMQKESQTSASVHAADQFTAHSVQTIVPDTADLAALPSVLFYTHLYSEQGATGRQVFVFSSDQAWEGSFGNAVGFVWEAIGCAKSAQADFLWRWPAPKPPAQLSEVERFLRSWPAYLENPENDMDSGTTLVRAKQHCSCFYYCWEYTHAAWLKARSFTSKLWHRKMTEYSAEAVTRLAGAGISGTITDAATATQFSAQAATFFSADYFDSELSSVAPQPSSSALSSLGAAVPTRFPLIPDVALHLRCSDIITTQSKGDAGKIHTHYGFLNFHHYASHIPPSARVVYVLSDPINRGDDGAICGAILREFVRFLRSVVPAHTSIMVKRGGEIMFAQAAFTLAEVTVCSPSTFCFWAAAASNTTSYYPVSSLIYAGKEVPVSHSLHWISDPQLQHFTGADDIQTIVQALTRNLTSVGRR